ncbi:accelerated cell death 2 (ACD2) [Wolffia australiana]
MVAALANAPFINLPIPSRRSSRSSLIDLRRRSKLTVSSSMESIASTDFPYLSPANRNLMLDLVSTIESSLGAQLLPSAVPDDVRSFQNAAGNCRGSTDIRHGVDGSKVDLVLKSWLHCELPFGVLDITSIIAYLRLDTDAPHLLLEFLQNSPNSLILIADLLPRRDLVLGADYLRHFYELSGLEKARQALYAAGEVSPFFPSSLYIRSLLSPTAMVVTLSSSEGTRTMEELVEGPITASAKELVQVWLDRCALSEREVASDDRAGLAARDVLIKTTAVDIDLAANLPPLFGPVIAGRIVAQLQKDFGL